MTVTIQLNDRTADALKAQAQLRGVSLDAYIQQLAEHSADQTSPKSENIGQSAEEFDAALEELFSGDTHDLPATTSTYSRGEIYHDHD